MAADRQYVEVRKDHRAALENPNARKRRGTTGNVLGVILHAEYLTSDELDELSEAKMFTLDTARIHVKGDGWLRDERGHLPDTEISAPT